MTAVEKYDAVADATQKEVVRVLGALLSDVWDGSIDCGEPIKLAALCESMRSLVSKIEDSMRVMEKLSRG